MNIVTKQTVNVDDVLQNASKDVDVKKTGKLLGFSVAEDVLKGVFNFLGTIAVDYWVCTHVTYEVVTYESTNPNMQTTCDVSALLIKPNVKGNPPLPLLSYQHGTQLMRALAPSCFSLLEPLNFMEVLVAMFMAAYGGYTVVMPDYQGMGKMGLEEGTKINQPYVAAEPLAQSVGDLLLDVKKRPDINWNNRLYMIGYSQGGYVTMAAAHELQKNPKYQEFKVNACAPCAGPYSLSQAMLQIMAGDKPYKFGFFLPMAIRGFNARYGDGYGNGIFTKEKAFKPQYQDIYDLADGYHTPEDVMAKMPAVPSETLSAEVLNQLKTKEGAGYEALVNNDDYKWNPSMPMYMYQCPDDDVVPYENSIIAETWFRKENLFIPLVPMFYLPFNTVIHVEAAIPCLISAYTWLKTFEMK